MRAPARAPKESDDSFPLNLDKNSYENLTLRIISMIKNPQATAENKFQLYCLLVSRFMEITNSPNFNQSGIKTANGYLALIKLFENLDPITADQVNQEASSLEYS